VGKICTPRDRRGAAPPVSAVVIAAAFGATMVVIHVSARSELMDVAGVLRMTLKEWRQGPPVDNVVDPFSMSDFTSGGLVSLLETASTWSRNALPEVGVAGGDVSRTTFLERRLPIACCRKKAGGVVSVLRSADPGSRLWVPGTTSSDGVGPDGAGFGCNPMTEAERRGR
jgi:hypothetical protein